MVYIHGGGFYFGAGSEYNGSIIVSQSVQRGTPVVYINFNYRLGPFGFPQGVEAEYRHALNLGLKDQLAALKWIQTNIQEFGGDPNKLTVFGESAGAISISMHYLSGRLGQFARAAIFESGQAGTTQGNPPKVLQSRWEEFVSAVPSCASLAASNETLPCLQNVGSDEMKNAFLSLDPNLFFTPAIDGKGGVLPDYPSKLLREGAFANLPFIGGTNLDEGTLFTPTSINSTAAVTALLNEMYSPPLVDPTVFQFAIAKVLQLYPDVPALGSPYNTGNTTFGLAPEFKQYAAIDGDIQFHAQRRTWMQKASVRGIKTFGYYFIDPQNGPPQLGVRHESEVDYVYGLPQANPFSQALSTMMTDYWLSFATSLDPNDGRGSKRPFWPQYTPDNQVLLQLNRTNTTAIRDTYRAKQIQYIMDNPKIFHQ